MRDIKFRGLDHKRQWHYGSLIISQPEAPLIWSPVDEWWTRVDPLTVGEFTGLHDKNGKPIYEGDIVQTYWIPGLFGSDKKKLKIIAKVVYKECAFELEPSNGWTRRFLLDDGELRTYGIEVIGNIHSNPELVL